MSTIEVYDSYYGYSQVPFGLTPDVRFCYPHRSYKRAKAYMQYALHRGEGFVVVTGRPGTGKTTLIQDLLKDLGSVKHLVARIDSTQLDADDLLRLVTYAFGVRAQGLDKATLIHSLRDFLVGRVAHGGNAVLIVDEAQNLSARALEELRLITNLQHGVKPLVQIFLVGQEPLRDLLRDPGLEQLHQRVVAACYLEPLDLGETRAYIRHRLLLAGWTGDPIYKTSALRLIFKASGGVPRLINKVCDRLLLHGSLEERHSLTAEDARIVLNEFREELLDRIDDENPDALPLGIDDGDWPELDDLSYEPTDSAAGIATSSDERPASPILQAVADTQTEPDGGSSAEGERTNPGLVLEDPSTTNDDQKGVSVCTDSGTAEPESAAGEAPPRQDRSSSTRNGSDSVGLLSTRTDSSERTTAEQRDASAKVPVSLVVEQTMDANASGGHEDLSDQKGAKHEGVAQRALRLRYVGAAGTIVAVVLLGYLVQHQGTGWVRAHLEGWGVSALLGRSSDGASVAMEPIHKERTESGSTSAPRAPDTFGENEAADGDGDPKRPLIRPSNTGPLMAEISVTDRSQLGVKNRTAPAPGTADRTHRSTDIEPAPSATATEPAHDDREPTNPISGGEALGLEASFISERQSELRRLELAAAESQGTGRGESGTESSQAEAPVTDEMAAGTLAKELRDLGYKVQEVESAGLSFALWEVPFAFDSAQVPERSYEALQKLTEVFLRNGNTKITIIGHTDGSGPAEYNNILSLRRAQAVAEYFHSWGLPDERISAEGHGENSPLVGEEDQNVSSSRQRRIEILVEPWQPSAEGPSLDTDDPN